MVERIKRKIIRDFANEEINRQVKFCQETFDLPQDWLPCVALNFSSKTKASEAGRNVERKPYVILELLRFQFPVMGHLEYPEYAKNMFIGSFKSQDWKLVLTALISHELSHAVQFTLAYNETSLRDTTSPTAAFLGLGVFLDTQAEVHGKFFQSIYRKLRKEFVNAAVEPYCMGIDPPSVPKASHPLNGKVFHHVELGKCTVIHYNEKAKVYKYKYVDRMGDVYQSSQAVMDSDADFDFYDNLRIE
jgi:hypothetical protein